MHTRILVTYATKTGSTEEVANSIAATLRERNLLIDLLPVTAVHTLKPYEAVVLGAALYIGRLHKDARRFISANQSALQKLPIAMFVLGPVEKVEKQWADAQRQLDTQLSKYPWLKPVALHIVGGKFDPANFGFPFNWILRKIPVSDSLDWDAIQAMADELATRFQPALTTSAH